MIKVKLKLINDYGDGSKNGTSKIIKCPFSLDVNTFQLIKYIEEDLEINLDDMWKIHKIYK